MSRTLTNLKDKKFGYWTVLEVSQKRGKSGESYWLCICNLCNKTFDVASKHLVCGAKSCKSCSSNSRNKSNHPSWKGYEDIPWTYWQSIKYGAKKRSIEFNITISEAWNILKKQDFKCALSGLIINIRHVHSRKKEDCTASLDRIDSTKGYIMNNIQWVHKDVNLIKRNFNEKYFLEIVNKIYNHANLVNSTSTALGEKFCNNDSCSI